MKKYIIGIDIGGTKVATGLVTEEGKLVDKVVLPTYSKKGFDFSLNQTYLSVEELIRKTRVKKNSIIGIGACAPGPLDPLRGIVHNPPNLKGWSEVPLASLLRKKFGMKAKIENDANCAGMAEVIWGAAKGYRHVFYVTVSTGIGTAIIVDGRIYHGKNGMAGEGGHVTIKYDAYGDKCHCGRYGCIEAMASGPHTVRRLVKKLKKNPKMKTSLRSMVGGKLDTITMVTLGDAAAKGDKVALDTIKEEGTLLGIWLGNMINLIDPEIIVIGGGVSSLGKLLFAPAKESILEHTINIHAAKTPVVRARLNRNVGIFGAASIFMKKRPRYPRAKR